MEFNDVLVIKHSNVVYFILDILYSSASPTSGNLSFFDELGGVRYPCRLVNAVLHNGVLPTENNGIRILRT